MLIAGFGIWKCRPLASVNTAQKMKLSITDFFSKCEQTYRGNS